MRDCDTVQGKANLSICRAGELTPPPFPGTVLFGIFGRHALSVFSIPPRGVLATVPKTERRTFRALPQPSRLRCGRRIGHVIHTTGFDSCSFLGCSPCPQTNYSPPRLGARDGGTQGQAGDGHDVRGCLQDGATAPAGAKRQAKFSSRQARRPVCREKLGNCS